MGYSGWSIPTGTQMGWRTTAGPCVSPSRQLSSCRASHTSLSGRCDAFGSCHSLPGSFLMDLWKQSYSESLPRMKSLASHWDRRFQPGLMVSIKQSSWALCWPKQDDFFVCKDMDGGEQPLCAQWSDKHCLQWQHAELPRLPEDLLPVSSIGTIPIQSYGGWGEEIFLSQQKVRPHSELHLLEGLAGKFSPGLFFSVLIECLFLILEGSELRHFAFSVFVCNYMPLWYLSQIHIPVKWLWISPASVRKQSSRAD